jgi:NAD(P)-dependent dehydrogenase (short-subunit alcohol dehydrogenase family)
VKQRTPRTIGLILMNHGIFTFGPTAKVSYDRMIEAVAKAEAFLEARGAGRLGEPKPQEGTSRESLRGLPALRRAVSAAANFPMIVSSHVDEQALSFARRSDLEAISQQGPATPDHVIRTKRLPMLGATAGSVASYADAYRRYFADQAASSPGPLTMLDPAPRIALDPELGLITIGRTAGEAAIAEDIYRHTIEVITRAEALGGYRALPTADLFDMEYWDLEQAKLKRQGAPKMFAGEIALVTGAASGIGRACVESLLARGAAVVGIDIDPAVGGLHRRRDFLGIASDVTDADAVDRALESAVRTFGGLDILILNAGVFPAGRPIAQLASAEWSRVLQVNLDANLVLMRLAHPLLKQAPRGGRVVVMGSKNVPAPGPGASAYSASKAALTQLARVAALEWGADCIRVNVLHPNAVFDTGIWSAEVLQQRAANYGLTVEQYKTNNVMRVEVTSRDVAELAAEMCGPLFAKTTGAQIPVDGGNERVI